VGLSAVLDRMLAKDPADRFQSPAEVAEALRPFTSGSDLAGVLGADGAANAPAGLSCAEAPTAVPGLWETASERTGRGRRLLGAPSRYALPVALAALCLLLGAGLLWLRRGGPPGPAAKPLEITELRVTNSREKGDKVMPLGDLPWSPWAVHPDDRLAIAADLSVPAYYYLIAFNPKGSEAGIVQLCQPEATDGLDAEAVRPERRTKVRCPKDFIPDAVGLQVFVLAASTKPLPPYKKWCDQADPPWAGVKVSGAWRWHFDGRKFTRWPVDRGRLERKEDVPEPLRKLCEFFKGRAEFEAVQVIAFPVTDGQK